uniref:Uncharacterized protein n=1 Tax=Myoviridae sp. ctPoO4 TaxID=2827685 RepID=A0A8S5SM67_9CAUD|nr:MAG TPA: hypothetical protein [Myoviridae sp. ctPoO4]
MVVRDKNKNHYGKVDKRKRIRKENWQDYFGCLLYDS